MADLITGPIDPAPDVAAQGASAALPGSTFEGIDPWETSKQIVRGIGNLQAKYGAYDTETGQTTAEPEASVPAEALKHLEVPDSDTVSGLKFPNPLLLSVAESMHDAKQEELMRASSASRQPDGFFGAAARGLVGMAAGMLDPVNVAASLVPVAGEARLEAMLARGLGEGLGGRIATSAAIGGARGAVAQAPLVGLRYGLSKAEGADYTMANAAADMVMGTLLGGGMHAVIQGGRGANSDWLGRQFSASPEARVVEADPVAREATARAAIAAVAEDRPVEVADYIRMSNEGAVRKAQIAALQREADSLRAEAAAVPNVTERVESPDSLVRPPVPDAATQARIDAVLDEMTSPDTLVTGARAAELAAEHRMLTEGARPGSELEQARSEAQRQGLLTAAARTEQRMRDLSDKITGSETVRRAAGSPEAEALATARQAEAAARVPPPERPELPPEPDAETLALHEAAAKTLSDKAAPDGMVRLYRGERPRDTRLDGDYVVKKGQEPGRYFTTDRKQAEHFGNIKVLDVHKDDPLLKQTIEDPLLQGTGAVVVPKELADRARPEFETMLTKAERAELAAADETHANAEGEAKAFENYGACLGARLV